MTPEEINHGNKIIADFIFAFYKPYSYWINPNDNKHYRISELKFHSCFDYWLMPAWYKFRDLHFELKNEIMYSAHRNDIGRYIAFGTIEESFKHLVKAIEWYNSIKK